MVYWDACPKKILIVLNKLQKSLKVKTTWELLLWSWFWIYASFIVKLNKIINFILQNIELLKYLLHHSGKKPPVYYMSKIKKKNRITNFNHVNQNFQISSFILNEHGCSHHFHKIILWFNNNTVSKGYVSYFEFFDW